jgi:hydroxymethylbilane synthase
VKLRIATRGSTLALTQTRWVAARLQEHVENLEIEEVQIRTTGDRIQDRPLSHIGGKGLFVSEVEAAVVRGEADFAVHSLKDVPGDVPLAEGMAILCVPVREDPHDVLITPDARDLGSLAAGAKVGTTSRRRIVQLCQHRPDLTFVPLRGNIETRLRKLEQGQCDAIVLAAAGLARVGLLEQAPCVVLPPDICLPSVGQGALAIEGPIDDERLRAILATIENQKARLEITAERAMLQRLEGNCHSPIAGHARVTAGRLELDGMVASFHGDSVLSSTSDTYLDPTAGDALHRAETLGRELAASLITRGARDMIRQAEVIALQSKMSSN